MGVVSYQPKLGAVVVEFLLLIAFHLSVLACYFTQGLQQIGGRISFFVFNRISFSGVASFYEWRRLAQRYR